MPESDVKPYELDKFYNEIYIYILHLKKEKN